MSVISNKHSVYKGVQILKETSTEGTYFLFKDKEGNRHVRNLKKGGSLAALKADIDWYVSRRWV